MGKNSLDCFFTMFIARRLDEMNTVLNFSKVVKAFAVVDWAGH